MIGQALGYPRAAQPLVGPSMWRFGGLSLFGFPAVGHICEFFFADAPARFALRWVVGKGRSLVQATVELALIPVC